MITLGRLLLSKCLSLQSCIMVECKARHQFLCRIHQLSLDALHQHVHLKRIRMRKRRSLQKEGQLQLHLWQLQNRLMKWKVCTDPWSKFVECCGLMVSLLDSILNGPVLIYGGGHSRHKLEFQHALGTSSCQSLLVLGKSLNDLYGRQLAWYLTLRVIMWERKVTCPARKSSCPGWLHGPFEELHHCFVFLERLWLV